MRSHIHDEMQKRLPWLVNGRLTDEERGEVEAHVRTCSDCQAVVRELQEMRDAIQTVFSMVVRASPWRWQRVSQRIFASEMPVQGTGPRILPTSARWRPWMHICMGVVLGVLLTGLVTVGIRKRSSAVYRTLSGPHQTERLEQSSFILRVAFRPDATEANIQKLLHDVRARIVDGPSAAGWYTLVVEVRNARERASLLTRLRMARTIVARVAVPEE